MKIPLDSLLPEPMARILFCSEGNPVAVLVTNKAGKRTQKPKRFLQSEAALAWCREHSAVMVYLPMIPARMPEN